MVLVVLAVLASPVVGLTKAIFVELSVCADSDSCCSLGLISCAIVLLVKLVEPLSLAVLTVGVAPVALVPSLLVVELKCLEF